MKSLTPNNNKPKKDTSKPKKDISGIIITVILCLGLGAYFISQIIPKDSEKKQKSSEEVTEVTTEDMAQTVDDIQAEIEDHNNNEGQKLPNNNETTESEIITGKPDDYQMSYNCYATIYKSNGERASRIWQPTGYVLNDSNAYKTSIKPSNFDDLTTGNTALTITWINQDDYTNQYFNKLKSEETLNLALTDNNVKKKYTKYEYSKVDDYEFIADDKTKAHIWIWKLDTIAENDYAEDDSWEKYDNNAYYVGLTDIKDDKDRYLGFEVERGTIDSNYLSERYPTIEALMRNIFEESEVTEDEP